MRDWVDRVEVSVGESRHIFAKLGLGMAVLLCTAITADEEKPAVSLSPTQNWSKAYKDFHELVGKLATQVNRRFYPEFTIIKNGNIIVNISIDQFSSTVLNEADGVLLAYRRGLQGCSDRNLSEYHAAKLYSYEQFGWALDNYVKLLVNSLSQQEDTPAVDGVRERKVSTDRTWYAFTQLLISYLEEKTDRAKSLDAETYAADRALATSLSDIARRVFHLELTTRFSAKEFVQRGARSQAVFRDLAQDEGGTELKSGQRPLVQLMEEKEVPTCKIVLPPRRNGQIARTN